MLKEKNAKNKNVFSITIKQIRRINKITPKKFYTLHYFHGWDPLENNTEKKTFFHYKHENWSVVTRTANFKGKVFYYNILFHEWIIWFFSGESFNNKDV